MPKLTITNDDGSELLSLQIPGPIDPPKATVAIIQALDALPQPKPPRAPRSDRGTKRQPVAAQ